MIMYHVFHFAAQEIRPLFPIQASILNHKGEVLDWIYEKPSKLSYFMIPIDIPQNWTTLQWLLYETVYNWQTVLSISRNYWRIRFQASNPERLRDQSP